MRYNWEPCDITCGRQVDSHNRAERYVIGYDPSRNHENGNMILYSLRDGMLVTKDHTLASMAAYLNDPAERAFRPVAVAEGDIQTKAAEPD
ncbi:hypothetical protein ACRCPS_17340 [Pseudomonas aeruginosa]